MLLEFLPRTEALAVDRVPLVKQEGPHNES